MPKPFEYYGSYLEIAYQNILNKEVIILNYNLSHLRQVDPIV